jgi:tetratricopeptide (TPR) repeat protein
MRLRPFIGWAVFFFLAAIIAQAVPSVTGSFYFLKGKHSFARGDYEAAVAAYERSVRSDPKFARGYVELGLAYHQLEKYPQAEDAFRKAVTIHDDSCAECGLGMVLHAQERNEEAEKALKKALRLNPRDVCAFNQLGRMYYKLDRYPQAIESFRSEINLRPSAIAYHFLGNSYLYSNQYEKALTAYREALRVDSNYSRVYVSMGHAAQNLRYLDEAIDAYQKAIRANADDAEARVGLISTELKRGNAQAAFQHYEVLRKLDPEWAARLFTYIEKRAAKASKARSVSGQ